MCPARFLVLYVGQESRKTVLFSRYPNFRITQRSVEYVERRFSANNKLGLVIRFDRTPTRCLLRPGHVVWNGDLRAADLAAARRGGSGSNGTTDNDRHPGSVPPPTSAVPCACAGTTGAYPVLSLRSTSKSRPHPVQRMRATYSELSTTGTERSSSGSSTA